MISRIKNPTFVSSKCLSLFLTVKINRSLQAEFGRIFSFLEFQGIPYYEMNWQISCIDI